MKKKLKIFKVIIVSFSLLLFVPSCTEWLEIEPENDLIEDEFWTKTEDVVIGWIQEETFERIIVPFPCQPLNPFSLARRLKWMQGPPLVLTGELRTDTIFWAERNGCSWANGLKNALYA